MSEALKGRNKESLYAIPGMWVALISVAFAFFGFALMLPVVPLAVIEGGGSTMLAGLTTTLFMAVTVLSQFSTAAAVRRFGYRVVIVVATILLCVPSAILAINMEPTVVLAVSAVRGIGFGSLCVAQYALVGTLVPAGMLGRASGAIGVFSGGAQMVGLPLGLMMVDAGLGFESVFLLTAVAGVVAAISALWMPNPKPEQEEEPGWTEADDAAEMARVRSGKVRRMRVPGLRRLAPVTRRIHRRPRPKGMVVTLVPALALSSVSMGYGAVSSFLPASIREADPVAGATLAGIMLSIIGGAVMTSRYFTGVLADKLQRPGTLMVPGLLLAVVGMLGFVTYLTLLPSTLLLVFTAIAFGAGFGMVQNEALLEMFLRVPRGKLAAASTVWNASFDTGTGIGSVVLGLAAGSMGYAGAFGLGAGLVFIGLAGQGYEKMQKVRAKRRPDN